MGLLEQLQALGCQLKLVQVVPKTKAAPRKISTRNVTLKELITQLHAENVRVLAESPVELTISFEKVFEAAEIKKLSNGWTIEQLVKFLQTKPYVEMDKTALQKAVLEKLVAENISPQELVKDSIAKDQALDAFEEFVGKKMKDRSSARQMRLAEMEKEMAALRQEEQEESKQWSQWRQKKENYGKEVLEAVNFLISCKELASDKNGSLQSTCNDNNG